MMMMMTTNNSNNSNVNNINNSNNKTRRIFVSSCGITKIISIIMILGQGIIISHQWIQQQQQEQRRQMSVQPLIIEGTGTVTTIPPTTTTDGIQSSLLSSIFQLFHRLLTFWNDNSDTTTTESFPPGHLSYYNVTTTRDQEQQQQQQQQEPKIQLSKYQRRVIPLTKWEKRSVGPYRICQPPKGIPNQCCLGSISRGGGNIDYIPYECNNTITIHERVAQYTKSYMKKLSNNNKSTNDFLNNFTTTTQQQQQQKYHHHHHQQQQQQQPNKEQQFLLPEQDCDICRIIDYLILYNWTLSFQGDSITSQSLNGLECELYRRGQYNINKSIEEFTNRPEQYGWAYGIQRITTLIIRFKNPSSIEDNNNNNNNIEEDRYATIKYFFIYRPAKTDTIELHNIILPVSDILVFDHGLHWYPHLADQYEEAMIQLLSNITLMNNQRRRKLQLLAWRETSAQHFIYPGGHFDKYERDINTSTCVPIQKKNDIMNNKYYEKYNPTYNRRTIMKNVAKVTNYTYRNALYTKFLLTPPKQQELIVLPFQQYTTALHYLHPGECTHYCHDPYIWLPIWYSLRIALDRTVYYNNINNNNNQKQ